MTDDELKIRIEAILFATDQPVSSRRIAEVLKSTDGKVRSLIDELRDWYDEAGHAFTIEKGHPNQVAGKKRPFHTVIPGFVTRNGEPVMSFGVVGGTMQSQGHTQMMIRIINYGHLPTFVK